MEVSLYTFITATLRKLGGPQNRSGHKAEKKLSLLGTDLQGLHCPTHSLDAVLTH